MKYLLPLLLICSLTAHAQSVHTDFDKKVIYADSLNISKANSATTMLAMLPELLNRPGENYVSGYSIEIDGMSVGDAGDAALSQLHLSDIEKIEVEDSPIADYQSNGQGGSINIVLRKRSTPEKPFFGSASLDGVYPIDIYPQVYLGYKKGKFSIRGLVLGEWYKTSNDVETRRVSYDKESGYSLSADETTNKTNFLGQLVRAYMEYSMTDRDHFKLNVSENTSHTALNADVSSLVAMNLDKYLTEGTGALSPANADDYPSVYASSSTDEKKNNITNFQALFNYEHKFNSHSNLEAEVQYVFNPTHTTKNFPGIQTFENINKSNQISGKVEYKVNLVPLSVTASRKLYSDLAVGVNANKTFLRENIDWSAPVDEDTEDYTYSQGPHSNAFHVMPYLTSESAFGKFRLKLNLEFQHYEYDMKRSDEPYTNNRNDFTSKLMAEWHFTPHRNLRFIFNRSIQRPTDEQVYPLLMFSLNRGDYVKGNVNLNPLLSHKFSIDYIADYKWGDHSLVLNVAASYNNVDDIIVEYRAKNPGQDFYYQSQYITFRNDGRNHIIGGDFMAIWAYRFLNVAFTANVFNNRQIEKGESNHYTNYNLSLIPSFNLTHGWKTDLNFNYFSKVSRKYETLGDYASASLSVSKSWGRIKAYIFGRVALTGKTTNTKTHPSGDESVPATVTTTRANLQHNKIGAGVMYVF